jgi:ABC-type transport system involved in multi-copper enzyme maturation permease subunit
VEEVARYVLLKFLDAETSSEEQMSGNEKVEKIALLHGVIYLFIYLLFSQSVSYIRFTSFNGK